MKHLHLLFSVVAWAGMVALWTPVASAATKYGSPAAQAALQFDPFNPTAAASLDDSFLASNPPIIVARGSSVQAPSLMTVARTPVDPVLPVLDVVDAPRVFEGPYLSGLKASFVVTLRRPTNTTVTVKYRTLNGTARAGIEYASKTGTLTFPPGRYAQVVLVDILNDDLKVNTNQPHPRTFYLEIFNPTGAVIGRHRGAAEITENGKGQVGITISNALPVFEVGSNLKSTFTVSLNRTSSQVVKVNYQTLNGTAQAGSDYQATSGTLTFQPGQTMKQINVPVFDNGPPNESIVETFFMQLINPQNAVLLRKQATAQIVEYSDGGTTPTPPPGPTPIVSISPANQSVVEGNTGMKAVHFTVSLSNPSSSKVKVYYSTANQGASSGWDYEVSAGALTFAPGQTSKSISVLVNGDTKPEFDERFNVNLYSPSNATIGAGTAKVVILNDD